MIKFFEIFFLAIKLQQVLNQLCQNYELNNCISCNQKYVFQLNIKNEFQCQENCDYGYLSQEISSIGYFSNYINLMDEEIIRFNNTKYNVYTNRQLIEIPFPVNKKFKKFFI